ncbi:MULTISPECIES: hypothetical protein [Microbacterium]|uniref:hypothetical protein n=1 Tax=Microbacterium TaxID=33882 RepID=UPI00034E8BF3|nr:MULTISPECIES: hypothetical protein [Microbacterium]EPD84178.1 hypothetical protein HMPREF1529_02218 [Microbacterium sp. oral taxon 186 str. F0373]
MQPGFSILTILGFALVAIGAVMALRRGRPMWWMVAFFGIVLLAAAAFAAVVHAL